ncbi:MAG: YHS domain-containing protein [Deferribacteraceae bacterium]|jgi:YHS domain-containing protein|nr:YHS domain-containing protein [Deferribacteraceae bacterium]
MMIKLVIFIVAALVLYGLIRNKLLPSKKEPEQIDTTNMERDPICNTYVPEDTPHRLKYYDKMYFFCSQTCMDKFKAEKAKG